MTHSHVEDDAFLAGMDKFLRECAIPEEAADVPSKRSMSRDEDLLLSSHELVAETEALLSSFSPCPQASTSLSSDTSDSGGSGTHYGDRKSGGDNVVERDKLAEHRRKIRNANAAKRRLKYSKKIKNERQLLKQQEKEMIDEVNKLQAKLKSEVGGKTQAKSVWKAIAARQLQGRLAAEKERRRLHGAVKTRTASIQALGALLQEQVHHSDEGMLGGDDALLLNPLLEAKDVVLFKSFLRDLDITYQATDDTLKSWGTDGMDQASYNNYKRKSNGDWHYFESLNVQSMPFDFQPTCDAMWRSMRLHHQRKNHQHYGGEFDPDNTIAVKFHVVGQNENGGSATLLVRMVVRRYLKRDRMILVWRANTKGEGYFSHLEADETGWTIVCPNDTNMNDTVSTPTVARTFIRFAPFATSTATGGVNKVDEFSRLAAITGEEDGTEMTRMMESLLLDDM